MERIAKIEGWELLDARESSIPLFRKLTLVLAFERLADGTRKTHTVFASKDFDEAWAYYKRFSWQKYIVIK